MTKYLRRNKGNSGATDAPRSPQRVQLPADKLPQPLAVPTQGDAHHESDEWHHAIFTHSLDGILLSAPDGRIFAANPAACRMLQRTEEEICRLGRDGLLNAHGVANMIVERQHDGHFHGELLVCRADGKAFPADISTALFRDKEGQERTTIFFRDVSDRQQAEQAFREIQTLFHSFMNNSPAAAYIKNETGHYVYVNALAARQIFGRKRSEVVGRTDSDLWPPETARKVREADTTVLETALPMEVEESAELADGTHHWVSLKFPISVVPGRQMIGGMSLDITERLKTEAALRENDHKRIRESLSLARILSSALPLAARLQELCQTTVELIGCDRSSIFLRDGEYYRARYNYGNPADIAAAFPQFKVHHHPLMTYAVETPGRVVIENDAPHSVLIDAEFVRQMRLLALMVVVLWDDTGVPVGFITAEYNERPATFAETSSALLLELARAAEVAIGTDQHTAARRQAEDALHQANSELENRVAERTHDLIRANADLRTEIAARQQVEDTLRVSEERYRIISQSISDYAFSYQIAEDGSIFLDWLTDSFTKITGYPVEEMLGKRNFLNSFIPPEDLLRIKQTFRTEKPDGPITFEFRLRHQDGTLHRMRSYVQRVCNGRDKPTRVHGAVQDITESKQAREEIEYLNRKLEQRVSELSDLNQDLESFSYSVSHDLRAPLRHIQGFVELLHKHMATTLDDKGQHYIEILTKSAKRMGTLIDDLLAFSRTARAEMRTTCVNLTQIVNEVLLDLAEETATRKIVWDVGPLPDVYGDVALLRIVMSNLLGNAAKYTRPRSTPRITIGWTLAAENERVYFVRDNGVGFDMQYVNKLFGVFQRLHRDDEFEGTGIGLATVQRIVRRLGGRIWAEGEIDRGATFYFSLPTAPRETER